MVPLRAHPRRNQERHSPSQPQWSSRGLPWKNLADDEWKGSFPEWLQSSSSRRTAMAGRDGAFLLPPSALTLWAAVTAVVTVTGSHGMNHSAFWAGEGGGEPGTRMRRGSAQELQRRLSRMSERHSSVTANGRRRGDAPGRLELWCPPFAAEWMRLSANNVGLL